MRAFRQAVEARDLAALTNLLAPNVVFHSPVSFQPYQGREQVGFILATVAQVFEDFVYVASTPRWSSVPGWASASSTAST